MTVEAVGPIPAALPRPLARPLEFARFDAADSEPREHGALRRRVRFRSVAQHAQLQWVLTQTQFDAFWDWHEQVLNAGEQAFDVRVAAQGDSARHISQKQVWWVARFATPWQAEAINSDVPYALLYRVSAALILHGTPSATRAPATLRASGYDATAGYALMPAPNFRASGTVANDGGAWYA